MISAFIKWCKHVVVTLRVSILSIFISLFIIATVIIMLIQSINYYNATNFTSIALMYSAAREVISEVSWGLKPAETEAEFSAALIRDKVLPDQVNELGPYTYNMLKMQPLVKGAFYGDEAGNYIYTEKEKNDITKIDIFLRSQTPPLRVTTYLDKNGKTVSTEQTNVFDYDPRTRPWYVKAKEKRHTIWTDVFMLADQNKRAIATATPVYEQRQLKGVFGLDITLGYLSRFMTKQKISTHGFSFIISRDEMVIAMPNKPPFTNIALKPGEMMNVHAIHLPLVDQSIDIYKKTGKEFILLPYQGIHYLVTYQPIPMFDQHEWYVGVIIHQNDFIGPLRRANLMTLEICILILCLGIVIVSQVVTRVVRPLQLLGDETDRIKRFELDQPVKMKSRIKEVIQLAAAMETMKAGLRHFQKYVPKVLVKQLIESGEDVRIGGQRKQLVIFFSDIENFTTLSEVTDPALLTAQLCDYFEALSSIILDEKGTIDKYIGDSIMAFWGAPLEEENPCAHAASAALRCLEKVKELNAAWQKSGKPVFLTRIGMNMGDAIVGNIGSSERFSYTVIGDTVNVANRIEEMNKIYQTGIMVSASIYTHLKDQFVLRMVDHVVVKGRREKVYLYELLSDDPKKLPFDIAAYSVAYAAALQAYEEKRWDEAISLFKQCLVIYPQDTLAPVFIARCQQ